MAWTSAAAAGEDAGLGSSTTVGNSIVALTQKMELGARLENCALHPLVFLNTRTPQNMQCMTAVGHNETSLARCSLTEGTRLLIRAPRGSQCVMEPSLDCFAAA